MSFTPITLTGQYYNSSGANASGTVTFQLTSTMFQSGNAAAVPLPLTVTLTAGAFSVLLLATDDSGTFPLDSAYMVTEQIDGNPTNSYYIVLPSDAEGGTISLSQCIQVLPTPNPKTNLVTVEGLEAAIAAALGGGGGGGGGGAVTSVFTRTGDVTAHSGDYTVSQVTGAAPIASPTFVGVTTAPEFSASGLTGATAASRYVGATVSGSPATYPSGGWLKGDFVIAQTGTIWICTTANGTLGTWSQVAGGGGGGAVSSWNTRTGAVVPAGGDYTVSEVTGAAPIASPTFTGVAVSPVIEVSGMAGSSHIARFVGATLSGPPLTGTYNTGDVAIDRSGTFWFCTAGGTSGTWVQVSASANNEVVLSSYSVTVADANASSPPFTPLIDLFTPNMGDVILDMWVVVEEAFDGYTPQLDWGTFTGAFPGSADGLLVSANIAPIPLGTADLAPTGNGGLLLGNGSSGWLASLTDSGITNGPPVPRAAILVTEANPVQAVVSQDGTNNGQITAFVTAPNVPSSFTITMGTNDTFYYAGADPVKGGGAAATQLFTINPGSYGSIGPLSAAMWHAPCTSSPPLTFADFCTAGPIVGSTTTIGVSANGSLAPPIGAASNGNNLQPGPTDALATLGFTQPALFEGGQGGLIGGDSGIATVYVLTISAAGSGGGGGGGGGGGAVSSVSPGDASVSASPTTGAVVVESGTLDKVANLHPPVADWSNNSHKITNLANGSGAQDAAAFGQIPTTASAIGGMNALTHHAVFTGPTYAANANEYVPFDTTSNAITATLPNAPADKTLWHAKFITQGGTNAVTINCAGSDVFNKSGGATTATLTLLNQALLLQYDHTNLIWTVLTDDLPLSQLDARYALLSGATMTGQLVVPDVSVSGLTGATAASRYIGATTGGSPAGSFSKGDWIVDQTGSMWVCTTAPSTWTQIRPGTPTGIGTTFVSTRFYSMFVSTGVGTAFTYQTGYAMPFYVGVTHTFVGIAVDVSAVGGTGSICRTGIYADNGSGYPASKLVESGTVVMTATGPPTPPTISQQLTPGLYWLVAALGGNSGSPGSLINGEFGGDASASIIVTLASLFSPLGQQGIATTNIGVAYSMPSLIAGGSLPTTFPSGATILAATSSTIPLVMLVA